MNLSARKVAEVRERNGRAASERSDQVEKSLQQSVKVGFENGLPVVTPSEGYDETPKLGDSVSPFYRHYVRGDDLLLPSAGSFLRELFQSKYIASIDDASDELNTDRSTIERAVHLHSIAVDGDESVQESSDVTVETLVLPGGEVWDLSLLADPPHTDSSVLRQLMGTCGMSVRETALYLSEQLGENVTEDSIRNAAYACGLLKEQSEPANSPSRMTAEIPEQPPPQSEVFHPRRKAPRR